MRKYANQRSRKVKASDAYTLFCANLRQQQLLRVLPSPSPMAFDFSSNDYLGLKQHPQMIATASAASVLGVGSGASRLITLEQGSLKNLEKIIAKSKNTQQALVFATGFQANISAISALLDSRVLGTKPLVFSDRLNHASMHRGCQLANARQLRYHHNDLNHLAWLLNKTKNLAQPRFILTESVFGMDGDVADLPGLIALSRQYNALLYVDEAHATGLYGTKGYGLTSDFDDPHIISMGTFSKALGTSGAYIACSRALSRYFINRCAGFIYSTAPSPIQVALMQCAWDLVPSLQPNVRDLFSRAATLRGRLEQQGWELGSASGTIIPLLLQTPQRTLAVQRLLASQGIRVSAIRPPTVPLQQSRLRIALTLSHTNSDIVALLHATSILIQSTNL